MKATVAVHCAAGHAAVLRCHPLHRHGGVVEPFPTLYWLECLSLHRQLAELERHGLITEIQRRVRAEPELARAVANDHRAYAQERWAQLDLAERAIVLSAGWVDALGHRGIAGIQSPTAVKCLHAHFAHHLARGSTIGRLIEAAAAPVCRSHLEPGKS